MENVQMLPVSKPEARSDGDVKIVVLSWGLLLTGIFAIVGALYSWGTGSLFQHEVGVDTVILWGDLLAAGPMAIAAGIGLRRMKKWGLWLSVACGGIFIYGSIQVYVMILMIGAPYSPLLIIPPVFGLALSAWIFVAAARHCHYLN